MNSHTPKLHSYKGQRKKKSHYSLVAPSYKKILPITIAENLTCHLKNGSNSKCCSKLHCDTFYIWSAPVNSAQTAASISPVCVSINISAQNICHATLSKLEFLTLILSALSTYPLCPPTIYIPKWSVNLSSCWHSLHSHLLTHAHTFSISLLLSHFYRKKKHMEHLMEWLFLCSYHFAMG